MRVIEQVRLGQIGRALDLDDAIAIRLTQDISAPGKTVYLGTHLFDELSRWLREVRVKVDGV